MGFLKWVEHGNPHDQDHADLYLSEARGRLDRMRARNASLDSRAGLLISSTAIAAALQAAQGTSMSTPGVPALTALAACAAIICGVLVLRAGKGEELDSAELRRRITSEGNEPFLDSFWVADKHFQHALSGEIVSKKKAWLLNFGVIALATAVVLSLLP